VHDGTLRTSSCISLVLALAGCHGSGGDDDVAAELEGSSESLGESSETQADTTSTDSTSTDSTDASESETSTEPVDILEQLQALEGLSVEEVPSDDPSVRLFDLHFLQPNDHEQPEGPWFEQHVYLQHRDVAAPMVLATGGYTIFYSPAYTTEPALLLNANQLVTEQRFFGTSRPDPLDWSLLTIEQAAADHHRLVEALKPIYDGRWLSFGGSKGGMTSIYHRRFYPDDVDATLAYVAPHSFSAEDDRYPLYLDMIGDPACAQALRDLQIEALSRRAAMVNLITQAAPLNGYTFERYGSYDRVFEAAVIDLRWAFWQRWGKLYCPSVPDTAVGNYALYQFLEQYIGWDSYSDANLAKFEPYYHQAAHQLGAPASDETHLDGLLQFPLDNWSVLLPEGTTLDHDPAAMLDISEWLASEGERLMFVYAEWDPWSGGAFDTSGATDTHVYWVTEGSHLGGVLDGLSDAEFDDAMTILHAWLGLAGDLDHARALRSSVQPLPDEHPLLPR
jgi:hypothetical protein